DDIPPTEPMADVDRQALAREQVDDRQRAEAVAIRELVRDEVHSPDLIAGHGRPTALAMDRGRVAPRPLPSERQAFLGVHAIETMLANIPAFPMHQPGRAAGADPPRLWRGPAGARPQSVWRPPPALVPEP